MVGALAAERRVVLEAEEARARAILANSSWAGKMPVRLPLVDVRVDLPVDELPHAGPELVVLLGEAHRGTVPERRTPCLPSRRGADARCDQPSGGRRAADGIAASAIFDAARAPALPYLPDPAHPARGRPVLHRGDGAARHGSPSTTTTSPSGSPRARDGMLDHLYVHPDAQGRGVGSALLATVQARTPRASTSTCSSATSGPGASTSGGAARPVRFDGRQRGARARHPRALAWPGRRSRSGSSVGARMQRHALRRRARAVPGQLPALPRQGDARRTTTSGSAAGIVARELFAAAGAHGFLGMAVPEELRRRRRRRLPLQPRDRRGDASGPASAAPGSGSTLHNDICLPYFLVATAPTSRRRAGCPASARASSSPRSP